jgi:Tfp pilus assembly protein PilZ
MSDAARHERRVHFRGSARAGRRVELRYRRADPPEPEADPDTDGAGNPHQAVTRNIGVGGAYILTPDPEPIGARLEIELIVPTSEQPIAVAAEVRWFIHPEMDADGAGMGVKFLDIDVEALVRLSEYFASLTGADEA